MYLFLIRHGEPIYEPDELTDLGKKQASALVERLTRFGVDEIYASPLNRAYQTALPLSEATGKPIIPADWLSEEYTWNDFTVKDSENRTRWIFREKNCRKILLSPEVTALGEKWYTHPFFPEKVARGIRRMDAEADRFLADFGFVHDREQKLFRVERKCDRRIALFAHGGVNLTFMSSVLDIPFPLLASHFECGHTGVTVLFFDDTGEECVPCVFQHSNDSHLYGAGLPLLYERKHEF